MYDAHTDDHSFKEHLKDGIKDFLHKKPLKGHASEYLHG